MNLHLSGVAGAVGGRLRIMWHRPRRTWPQLAVISFNIILVMVCLTSAYALAFYNRQLSDIPRVPLQGSLATQASGSDPQNFLIVGADSADGLDPTDPVLAGRDPHSLTDTIMILRIDPNQEKAWLLSLPRDLHVNIAGHHGSDRINTVLQLGGPQLLIETIKEDFGIPIHHFLQVNFFGFKRLVDVIEGVNVYFNYPARDANSGLSVDEPGCRRLIGDEALAFIRSRHYEAKIDGRWQSDTTDDHGRIARQQYFIKQALHKAIDLGGRNPVQMNSFLDIAKQYIQIDNALTPGQILDLGARFDNFHPDDLEVYEPPTTEGYAGKAAVLFLDAQRSQDLFNIFRGVNPLSDIVASTRIEVRNGTGRVGEAQGVADELKRRGFAVTDVSDDKNFQNDRTTVGYAPGPTGLANAVTVARYLEGNATFVEEPALASTDHFAALVVGRDFAGIRKDPRPASDFAEIVASASTSGTVPGVDPATPPTTVAPAPPPQNARSMVPKPPPGTDC